MRQPTCRAPMTLPGNRCLYVATILSTLSCGDGGTEPVPPAPGVVAGRIVVEENPTLPPGYGFGPNPFDRIARIEESGPEHACERPCHEVAVTMGSDTVFTDREGRLTARDSTGE